MSDSVAGRIRIDLLANVAQFKAGMREAGRDGLGSFQDEVRRFNRRGGTQKAIAEQIASEKAAWKAGMQEIRKEREAALGFDRNTVLRFNALSGMNRVHDLTRERQMRLREMLPFGMSTRTELTREAALTAAAIGDGTTSIVQKIKASWRDVGLAGMRATGYSPLGGFIGAGAKAVMAHPIAASVAIAGGMAAIEQRRRASLIQDVARISGNIGHGVQDTSMLLGAGMPEEFLNRFAVSMSQKSKGFGLLGLDANAVKAKPIKDALMEVATGFDKTKDPIAKAQAAVDLFGRSGMEVISILRKLRKEIDDLSPADIVTPVQAAKQKAMDTAKKSAVNRLHEISGAIGRAVGSESGIGTHMMRAAGVASRADYMGLLSGDFSSVDRELDRIKKEDYEIKNADRLEKNRLAAERLATEQARAADEAKKYKENMEKARDVIRDITEGAEAINGRDNRGLNSAIRGWEKQGIDQAGIVRLTQEYGRAMYQRDIELTKKSAREMLFGTITPEETFRDEMGRIKFFYDEKLLGAREMKRLEVNRIEGYYRTKIGLDNETARRELQTPGQRLIGQLNLLRTMGRSLGWRPTEIDALVGNRVSETRASYGITSPEKDYAKNLRNLAIDRELFSPAEIQKAKKGMRRAALAGLLADQEPAVSPMAAMALGSREAHMAIAGATLNARQVGLAQRANQLLDAIERNTNKMAVESGMGGNIFQIGPGR